MMLLLLAGCREDGAAVLRPVAVTVTVAEPGPVSRVAAAPCVLEGADQAVVAVADPVRVETVHVSPGDSVAAGQPLLSLQTDDALRAGTRAAAAGVAAARRAQRYAEDDLERMETLAESGAVPPSALEDARARREEAAASLREAGARYRRVRADAEAGLVRAPFDGVVVRVAAREGNPASGGLVSISGGSAWRAELLFAQRWLGEIGEGQPVFFETSHYPGSLFGGTVTSVSPALDPVSGLLPVRVTVEDPGGRLFSGLDGIASVAVRTEDSLPVLPRMALQRQVGGGWRAAVVEDGRARFRDVQTGISNGFTTQVSEGLSPGDSVIVLGHTRLEDGDSVLVVEE
jgi:membrane fusion protein (multidrug efflux system)